MTRQGYASRRQSEKHSRTVLPLERAHSAPAACSTGVQSSSDLTQVKGHLTFTRTEMVVKAQSSHSTSVLQSISHHLLRIIYAIDITPSAI